MESSKPIIESSENENPFIKRNVIPRTPPRKEMATTEGDKRKRMEEVIDISDPEESSEDSKKGKPRARTNSLPERRKAPILGETEQEGYTLAATSGRPTKRIKAKGVMTPLRVIQKPQQSDEDEGVCQVRKLLRETRDLAQKVFTISKGLTQLVAENPNTKVEIKKSVEELAWVAWRLEKRGQEMVKPVTDMIRRENIEKGDMASETEAIGQLDGKEANSVQEDLLAEKIEEALKRNGGKEGRL